MGGDRGFCFVGYLVISGGFYFSVKFLSWTYVCGVFFFHFFSFPVFLVPVFAFLVHFDEKRKGLEKTGKKEEKNFASFTKSTRTFSYQQRFS